MDLLKAEMERKRKAINQIKSSSKVKKTENSSNSRRFLKRGDILRAEEEMEEHNNTYTITKENKSNKHKSSNEERSSSYDEKNMTSSEKGKSSEEIVKNKVETTTTSGQQQNNKTKSTLSPDEVTSALRSLGLPVRLFGEITKIIDAIKRKYEDKSRVSRLNEAKELTSKALATISENDEFRLGSGHGIRNRFLDKRGDVEKEKNIDRSTSRSTTAGQQEKKDTKTTSNNDNIISSESTLNNNEDDPHKLIHHFFKSLLKQWEDELSKRTEQQKRTISGKNETKTLKQCRDYIRPLFKLCKKRKLESSLMSHLVKIVNCCKQGEFVSAHNAYVDVSIGRAAWPIGVTMVGIHARTGRAKIESANVAHVMNSEVQRKYLTSVKRLMTYCQKLRPDVCPSKKVLT